MELAKVVAWWNRINYEIAPWGWHSDPRLEGITEEQFEYLRSCPEEPTEVPALFR